MTASPAVVLLSIGIGAPLLLLALGVLYHAHVVARQAASPSDPLADHVREAASESGGELLAELQSSMREIRGQLTGQRQALSNLLSDAQRRQQMATPPDTAPVLASASGAPLEPPAEPAAPTDTVLQDDDAGAAGDLSGMIRRLVAEGLSDRAIARRLRVGLEEVRIARSRLWSRA
jgi:hypothetical protein